MRALVVYESMFGNTRVVASNVADGLRAAYEVTLVPVAGATADLLASADLLVVGGPTHMHGMSSSMTRRMAAQAAAKPGSGLTLDPDATGPGVHDLLKRLGWRPALAAAFDTRIEGVPTFTGQASRRVARLLKRHGCRIIAAPESFLVTQESTLAGGEAARARRWGEALGVIASGFYVSSSA
jgi:Flavodoxin domain